MNRKLICNVMIGVNLANIALQGYVGNWSSVVVSAVFIGLFVYLRNLE